MGINIQYKIQKSPRGIADAFILGEKFINGDSICLILGDNIFYGLDFSHQLNNVVERTTYGSEATIFGYTVKDPHRYGVIEFDEKGNQFQLKKNQKTQKASRLW